MTIHTVTGGLLGVNCYAVETGKECVVFDPGVPMEQVLREISCPITVVLMTHAHVDHVLFLEEYKRRGIPSYIHELDNAALGIPALNLSGELGHGRSFPNADHLVREGDRLSLGGLEIEVMHTPGHTVGSVCYRFGDTLISGDTLFRYSYGRTDFPGGSSVAMTASLKRLKALPKQIWVYPGHGESTSIAEEQWW